MEIIGHIHIVASTRVSALQLGQDAAFWNCQPRSVDPVQPTLVISSIRSIWPILYQSQSQKNPKDIQFECSSKKYLIIFDKRCKIWQHLNVFKFLGWDLEPQIVESS